MIDREPARSQSMAGPTYENPNEDEAYEAPQQPPREPADEMSGSPAEGSEPAADGTPE